MLTKILETLVNEAKEDPEILNMSPYAAVLKALKSARMDELITHGQTVKQLEHIWKTLVRTFEIE
jgi:hypothetical protein